MWNIYYPKKDTVYEKKIIPVIMANTKENFNKEDVYLLENRMNPWHYLYCKRRRGKEIALL